MGGNLTFNDNDDVQLKGATDATLIGNVSDSLKVNVTATALPTGAATAANQTTEITSLQILDDVPTSQNGTLNKGVPVMGQLDDTGTTAATEDAVAVARITAQRALHTNLRNNAGTEIATAAAPLRIDPTGTTTQPVSGTVAVTQSTSPWVTSRNWTLSSTTDSVVAVGDVASGATDSGNPVKTAGVFNTTQPTVTNGQRVNTQMTARGALIVSTGVDSFNINNVSGTISLPTGASTAANQTTMITALQILDDVPSSFNVAFSKGVPVMGQLDDTSTTAATEDNVAPVRITAQRSLHINLRSSSGTELATSTNQAFTKDVLNIAIQHRNQAFTNSATQALGAATILSGRKFISITPIDGTVYWGITGVTSSTGTPIFRNQTFTLSVTDNVSIFCVTASGTVNCRIAEGS